MLRLQAEHIDRSTRLDRFRATMRWNEVTLGKMQLILKLALACIGVFLEQHHPMVMAAGGAQAVGGGRAAEGGGEPGAVSGKAPG